MFLPLIGLFLCWLGVMVWQERSRAVGLVKGIILWSTYILLITETLSVPSLVNSNALMMSWAILILLILWHLTMRSRLNLLQMKQRIFPANYGPYSMGMLAPVFFVAASTLAVAIVSPPNNWDSMTYHMSRVEHWRSNASVSHYPTNSVWQLFLSPFAEFIILQFQTLGHGSDYFANIVQWLFFIACMAVTSSMVKILGGSPWAQTISILAVATTPMVIMQATSTQNDVVCSFFVAAVAFFSFKLCLQPQKWDWAYLSLAVALAVASKGTAYAFLPPFIIWALWDTFRKNGIRAMLKLGVLIGFTVVLLNGGHWFRNFNLWGHPLGDPEWLGLYRNELYGLKELVQNVLLNTLLHLGTPFVRVNSFLDALASFTSSWTGLSLNDPRLNFTPQVPIEISLRTHDTFAGNALTGALLLGALGLTALKGSPVCRRYAALWVASALLFCFLLKWAPFNTRLHTPLFVLGAVLIGLSVCSLEAMLWATDQYTAQLAAAAVAVFAIILIAGLISVVGVQLLAESVVAKMGFFLLEAIIGMLSVTLVVRNRRNKELLGVTIVCLMTLGSFPWLLCSETRPVFSLKYQDSIFYTDRIHGYFAERHVLAQPYIAIVQELDATPDCTTVGFKGQTGAWEYPFWALSSAAGIPREFVHVGVSNASSKQLRGPQRDGLCAIVAIEQPEWRPAATPGIDLTLPFSSDPSIILYQVRGEMKEHRLSQ